MTENKKNFGICFSREFVGNHPLSRIGFKLPVYLRFLDLCQAEDWNVFVLTRKTYLGGGVFDGVWSYKDGNFSRFEDKLKIDLVYDRTGGISFPKEGDNLTVVNRRDFKILAWNKWKTYKEIGEFMPKSYWVGEYANYESVVDKIATEKIVLKPFGGLEGLGIYIGPKAKAGDFEPRPKDLYIAQEFLDTSGGIPKIVSGPHDLRVVVVNNKIVWCHVRVPAAGKLLANAAQGGSLTEIDPNEIPKSVKGIVKTVSQKFYEEYDNPVFSLDFGMGKDGIPKIFEINDQIGFPRWEMKNRDVFLNALINNFKSKLY